MRVSLDEFFGLSETERNSGKVVYCIEEDRHVITNGKVFGMLEAGGRSIAMWDSHIRLPYQRMYEDEIAERQRKTMLRQNKPEVEPMAQPTAETISERPAVEKLVKETEVKLNALVNEGEQKLKNVENDGAEKLAAVVKEGEAKVEVHRNISRRSRTRRR